MMTEALMDFNEACKLDPKDKSIGTNSNNDYKHAPKNIVKPEIFVKRG